MQGGAARVLAVIAGALASSTLALSSASAQIPDLPPPPELPPPADAVPELLQQPLPPPVEDVVQDTPAGPIVNEVRELVGGGSDPGEPGGPAPAPPQSAPAPAPAAPDTERAPLKDGSARESGARTLGAGKPSARGGAGGSSGGAADTATAGGPPPRARRTAPESAPQPLRRTASAEPEERGGPVTRTLRRIVEVVPDWVWIALAALLALACALAARARLARRRAIALEAERQELLRDVDLLERALLPAVPERLGASEATVAYRPAAGPAAGGDFYDAFELPGGRAAVIVGDVSGHGQAALERTMAMRSKLHAFLETGMSPRAALEAAGRVSPGDSSGDFTTVVLGLQDPDSGTITYAAAGHPPPIFAGPASHEPLTTTSAPPLGIGVRTGVRQTTVPFPPGSLACFFTDGLLESRTHGELFGRDRLVRLVGELGPDEPVDALLERVIGETDETPDDMAACLLRAVAGSSAATARVEELELAEAELDLGVGERFLRVCGVPHPAIAQAMTDARRAAVLAGAALLRVTIDSSGASVTVLEALFEPDSAGVLAPLP